MAMGGEGGGVLADWIVDLGEANGWLAQTTSVPGVAQRTGATIYYVELYPASEAERDGATPVLALMPLPGDVDVVLASELMECGRAVQRGLVTPDRTTLVASTHRVYSITEKSALGDGRVRRALTRGLRLRQPQRVIVPLCAEEVARFWRSFRTFRNLALVGLMLLDGLRSCEVLALRLEDLQLADAHMRVLGKGNKKRVMPLPPEILEVLEKYLRLERPLTNSSSLFVSLKGRQRGRAMTPAGLRSLFRHHRLRSRVLQANAHRLRHTFGADMVRAGISLPALQRLMGHSQIHTTMLYVQLAPQDVWREYARAIENRTRFSPPPIP